MQNTDIMSAMTEDSLSKTLKRLLFEQNLKPTELARLTQVPQPTIQRIIAGTTARPHPKSLEPIANFFNISLKQLKGIEPIDWLEDSATESTDILQVPLLPWTDIVPCLSQPQHRKKYATTLTDAPVSEQSFATQLTDNAMEPLFPANTTLIFDPNRQPKDRSYVLAQFAGSNELVFRQLIINGRQRFLRTLSPHLAAVAVSELNPKDQILATLTQAKHNFDID